MTSIGGYTHPGEARIFFKYKNKRKKKSGRDGNYGHAISKSSKLFKIFKKFNTLDFALRKQRRNLKRERESSRSEKF